MKMLFITVWITMFITLYFIHKTGFGSVKKGISTCLFLSFT